MTARTSPVPIGRPSFLGAPRGEALDGVEADVAVVGIPYTTPADLTASRGPSSEAPGAVREQSQRFVGRTTHHDFDLGGELFAGREIRLVDCGDVPATPGQYANNARTAAAVVEALLERGSLPVLLGGDGAAALPGARACAARGSLGIVHLGAGLDWEDDVNGIRDAAPSVMRRAAELPGVTAMAHVGLRGSGTARPRDVADACAAGSVLIGAEEVHEVGVGTILPRIPVASRYYVSLDVAALDPAIAPGVEAPAFGGLTYFEATNLLKGLAARAPIVGIALVGIVPARDLHGMTSLLGARLILNLLGALARAGRIGRVERREAARSGAAPPTGRAPVAGAALVGGRR